jgi:hypothetical protein
MATPTKIVPDWRGVIAFASLLFAAVAFAALGHSELAHVALGGAITGAVVPTIAKNIPRSEDPS